MPQVSPGQIALVGSSHKVAPVHVRDALFPDRDRAAAFYGAVEDGTLGVDGAVLLSTCSRVELYVVAPSAPVASVRVHSWLLNGMREHTGHIYAKMNDAAVTHLHAVAAGLDSIVLGEHEILGQVGDALKAAQAEGTAGPILERLFRGAMRAGRRARDETAIGRGPTSLAFVAARIAGDVVPPAERRRLVIVGAGHTARLAAHGFHKLGWSELIVANRTRARAEALASEYGGRAAALEDLDRVLDGADTLLAAVSSERPVLSAAALARIANGNGRRLLALDLGNPRNVEPAARRLDGVDLRDLDDLSEVGGASLSDRAGEIPAATAIVEQETARFNAWLAHRKVVPLVKRMRESFEEIAEAEMLRHAHRFSEEDREALERFTRSLVRKLLHEPIARLKEIAEGGALGEDEIADVQEIFTSAGWAEPREAGLRS